MPDILELIEQEPEQVEEVLEYQGSKYLFKGVSDASELTGVLVAAPGELDKFAKHFTTVTGRPVDPVIMRVCMIVHKALQNVKWDEEKEDWVPMEKPYDVSTIVVFAQKFGADFITKWAPVANRVLNLAPDTKAVQSGIGISTFDGIIAGNSDEPEDNQQ